MTDILTNTARYLESALAKLAAYPAPPLAKAALCFSGGLDSVICAIFLREKYPNTPVIAYTVDVGQGEDELARAQERGAHFGLDVRFLDAKPELAEWLTLAIRANVDYQGYPCATSMTRQLIGSLVARQALDSECDAIIDGSSGKGNDQFRIHNSVKAFAPDMQVILPVRDVNLTRLEEMALCEHYGVPIDEVIVGGEDRTIWARSIASGGITLQTELPDDIWVWYVPPREAPDDSAIFTLTYEAGVPVAMNGQRMPLLELVPILNELGGVHAIGRIDVFEDGIMDLKSREVYEAPAATILLALHRDLEQLTLTKDELAFKRTVDARWSELVFGAEWFTPLKRDLDAFVLASQAVVNGTYEIELYKGNLTILRRLSPSSLYFPDIRSIQSPSFDQRWAGQAALIRGLPLELLARRDARWAETKQRLAEDATEGNDVHFDANTDTDADTDGDRGSE